MFIYFVEWSIVLATYILGLYAYSTSLRYQNREVDDQIEAVHLFNDNQYYIRTQYDRYESSG